MTNYNKRLDEILELLHNSWLDDDYDAKDPDANEAKQAITSLIKELVAEAKPKYKYCGFHGGEGNITDCPAGNPENMVDVYRQYLLKALEEV